MSFPRLVEVLDRHLAGDGRLVFAENSFFSPIFRFVRSRLVDSGRLRKVGSHDETSFDRERLELLRTVFYGAVRRVDHLVLFGRAAQQFLARRPRLAALASDVGSAADRVLNVLPARSRLKVALSYHQTIEATRGVEARRR